MSKVPPSAEAVNKALYDELVVLARPHVDKDPRLGILDPDTEQYEWQAYDYHCVPGKVADVGVVDFIGSQVVEGFVEISEKLMPDWRRRQARTALQSGQSLYVATSHSNVIDPGPALAAVVNPLRRDKGEANDFQTGIILNKMISVINYQVDEKADLWLPCIQALQLLCDRTYMSFPQSETFRNSDAAKVLPPGHVRAHNGRIKDEIIPWLAEGGVILSVAPSGSTHKPSSDGTKSTLPTVTQGTAEMMTLENVRVAPIIMDLDARQPFMEFAAEGLYRVKRWQGAHQIQRRMAAGLNEHNSGDEQAPHHVYEQRRGLRDLPGVRRRYAVEESLIESTGSQ